MGSLSASTAGAPSSSTQTTLLNGVLVTGAGSAVYCPFAQRSFYGSVAGTGAVTATILVQGSLDNSNWLTLATITLSGTTSATDGCALEGPWPYMRGNVSAITGTSAAATLIMGT